MNLADRLRSIVQRPGGSAAPGSSRSPDPPYVRGPGAADDYRADPAGTEAADLLGGEWHDWRGHAYLVVERRYAPGGRHGDTAIADAAPGDEGSWRALSLLEPSLSGRRLLFVDLETTGLAGGAGTYAFLVGYGWFDGASFRVRQLLLANYAAERGMLEAVGAAANDAGALATYNGKTFDVPLLETRCALHRMPPPFDGVPHVDLLHPARRLWRSDGLVTSPDAAGSEGRRSCSLTTVEEAVLGFAREGDVAGFQIPARYFHYVRSGDARPLEAVLEHNRLDLLSLAFLTARAARLLEDGAGAARTPREALGLGRLYQRAGMLGEAGSCFERAVSLAEARGADPGFHAEALRASALVSRRTARHADAAEAWCRLLSLPDCPPRLAQEASEALAVHHEHRLREPREARRFALASLELATGPAQATGLRHRLTRLERKIGRSDAPARLFAW